MYSISNRFYDFDKDLVYRFVETLNGFKIGENRWAILLYCVF